MADIRDIDIDFKVHDGYVAFSAEIVRLALLSPAIFAFFIAFAGKEPTTDTFSKLILPGRCSLETSFFFMGLAVLFGLCHRYCAIDFMSTLVEKQREGGSMHGDWRTWASTVSIFAASVCLIIGACFLFRAVFMILGGN